MQILKGIVFSVVIVICIASISDYCADHPVSATSKTSIPAKHSKTIGFDSPDIYKIKFIDGRMKEEFKSGNSEDRRPYYIVSGRIVNNTNYTLNNVTLAIPVWVGESRFNVKNRTFVTLNNSIPPGGVITFAREIQFLPPEEHWNWDAVPSKAEVADNISK